jgi:hemoglobin
MQPAAITDDRLAELVTRFYAKVRRDPEIGPVFEAGIEDWEAHLEKLAGFWSSVMLTSGRYKGNPVAAHMKHGITPAMFTRWLQLWEETVRELFAPEAADALAAKAHRIGDSLKLAMFYRP